MTVFRGFVIIAVSGLVCAMAGAGIGLALGTAAPTYYRSVFRNGKRPDFDPAQMGLGLGLTQGLVCGLLIGCVVVLAVAWYHSRQQINLVDLRHPSGPADRASEPVRSPSQVSGLT
jgi:hypothetical protein